MMPCAVCILLSSRSFTQEVFYLHRQVRSTITYNKGEAVLGKPGRRQGKAGQ